MSSTALLKPKHDLLSKHRVEALADGLFAIVMTLLVLDLKVPELEQRVGARELGHAIASQWRLFLCFGMTFVLAAVFWMLQQRILRMVRTFDRLTAFLTIAPLLFVSLLPFSTATFARYLGNPTACTLYFGNQFIIAFFIVCLWYKNVPATLDSDESRDYQRIGIRVRSLAFACLVACLVALSKPQFASESFIASLLALRLIERRIRRI